MVNPYTGQVENPPQTAREDGVTITGHAARCGYRRDHLYLYCCPCGKFSRVSGAQLNAGKVRCNSKCKGAGAHAKDGDTDRVCTRHGLNGCYPERLGCWVDGRWELNPSIRMPAPLRVVSAAILARGNPTRILLAKRQDKDRYSGRWECPGGKIERGETPESALKREVWEELGVSCTISGKIPGGKVRLDPPLTEVPIDLTFFDVTIIGTPRPLASSELVWYTSDQLTHIPHMPAQRACMDALLAAMGNG